MADAIRAGISRRTLYALRDQGVIELLSRGIYRLGRSEFKAKLILKDALMLRVWKENVHRPTMDIDAAALEKCMSISFRSSAPVKWAPPGPWGNS